MSGISGVVEDIYARSLEALDVVRRHAHHTPLDLSRTFSRMTGASVYLKYENLQKTGAFKIRGALYKIYTIHRGARGVVAASAGNHAQGVAYAAQCFGVPAVIVMPVTSTISKVEATRSYGAEVVLHGAIYDEAEAKAREIAREKGYEFIPAFDDPDIIAGQATVAHELLQDLPDVDAVVVPVGGGGLASGIATVLKKRRPKARVIGVEPENVPKFLESLKAGRPVTIRARPTIADGLAVKRPGELTFKIIRELVDDIVTVSEGEISQAIYLLLERAKVLAEGAGAAALAALISGKVPGIAGRKVVAIVSGGNIDLTMLNRVIIRGLRHSGRVVTLYGHTPDFPGVLAEVASILAKHRANILEVLHDRGDPQSPPWHTTLRIIVEVPSRREVGAILAELEEKGYTFTVLE